MPAIRKFTVNLTKCSRYLQAGFLFLVDARSADNRTTQHVNIRINAKGKAEYDIYETGDAIRYDLSDMVTFTPDQVVESGEFDLSDSEMGQLWKTINENNFFDLTDDYRMALGSSFAFVLIEANGRSHMVDNIGMEVPAIRAIVEAVNAMLPENVTLK